MALEVINLGSRIKEYIDEEDDRYLERNEKILAELEELLKLRKLILAIEGAIGAGKTAATKKFGMCLDALILLENAETPEIKRYLEMLYSGDREIQKVGAVGINNAYYVYRIAQYAKALRAPGNVVLDRILSTDLIYQEMFVESGLMTQEQVDDITQRRRTELGIMRPKSLLTAPKEAVLYLTGEASFLYKRKTRRGRDVEKERGNGKGGVSKEYLEALCQRYPGGLRKSMEQDGFDCPIIEVPQVLEGGIKFDPTSERHRLAIMEFLVSYLKH